MLLLPLHTLPGDPNICWSPGSDALAGQVASPLRLTAADYRRSLSCVLAPEDRVLKQPNMDARLGERAPVSSTLASSVGLPVQQFSHRDGDAVFSTYVRFLARNDWPDAASSNHKL